jgi:hypothetical protein
MKEKQLKTIERAVDTLERDYVCLRTQACIRAGKPMCG